jgi:two-component system LytT family response regulator
VVIIEDEKPARAQLERAVREWDPSVEIAASLGGVQESIRWLQSNPPPDLFLSDIQLSDGIALTIFDLVPVSTPVVFCTAHDEYLEEALQRCGIDFLQKPLQKTRLRAALDKYLRLRAHFSGRLAELSREVPVHRERLVARRGADFVPLATDEIAYFVSEDKVVVLVERSGRRALCDGSLAELEQSLDPTRFFRVNRKYLVQRRSIARYRSYFKGRTLLTLEPPAAEDVVVSQESGAAFRNWIGR